MTDSRGMDERPMAMAVGTAGAAVGRVILAKRGAA